MPKNNAAGVVNKDEKQRNNNITILPLPETQNNNNRVGTGYMNTRPRGTRQKNTAIELNY